MTKNELLNTVRAQTDRTFLCDIVRTGLSSLPSAYVETLVYELYTQHVYDGIVYTLTNKKNPEDSIIFAGPTDVHDFFTKMNPKYTNDQLFRARNKEGRSVYGYTITTKEKETA